MINATVNEAAGVETKSAQPRRAPSDGSALSKTFDEFCNEWNVTPQERADINTYLAVIRMRKIPSL